MWWNTRFYFRTIIVFILYINMWMCLVKHSQNDFRNVKIELLLGWILKTLKSETKFWIKWVLNHSQTFSPIKVGWQITNFGTFPVVFIYHNLKQITWKIVSCITVLTYGTLFEMKLGKPNPCHVFKIKLLLTFLTKTRS
jgi:hypothetical protein